MRAIVITFIGLFIAVLVVAQPTRNLVGYYNLNDLNVSDLSEANNPPAIVNGNPETACGISGQSMVFDGIDDDVQFEGDFFGHFDGDFTISFFMLPDQTGTQQEIMSFVDTCSNDSLFNIIYRAASNQVIANLSGSTNIDISLFGNLDPNTCWQHIILTRDDGTVELFVNGISEFTLTTPNRIPFQTDGVFRLSNSPCVENGTFQRYEGRLDELRIYNRLVEVTEFSSLGFNNDQILTPDTTVLDGASVNIRTSNTCASSFSWFPTTGVDMSSDRNPIITATQTQDYVINFEYPSCTTRDTINIRTVDPTLVNCKEILVPTAFTPNGDGLNDVFGLSNPFVVEEFVSFEIMDRWGATLFRGMSINDFWDGNIGGESALPGVYVYDIRWRCENEEQRKLGSFSLLR